MVARARFRRSVARARGQRGFGWVSNTSLSTSFLPERMRLRPAGGWGERNHAARAPARPSQQDECPSACALPRIPSRRRACPTSTSRPAWWLHTYLKLRPSDDSHSLHSVHMYSHVVRRTRIDPDTTSNSNMYILHYLYICICTRSVGRGWLAVADLLPLYDQTTSEISSPMQ